MEVKIVFSSINEANVIFKKFRIDEGELLSFCNLRLISLAGYQYLVFRHNDDVLKIERKKTGIFMYLNEQTARTLMELKTKRILMPTGCIYDEDSKYCGYAMKYIGKNRDFADVSMDKFLDELHLVTEDKDYLSEQLIFLDDINISNFIYSDGIYIIDPGFFRDYRVAVSRKYLDYVRSNGQTDEEMLFEIVSFNNNRVMNQKLCLYLLQSVFISFDKEKVKKTIYKIETHLSKIKKNIGSENIVDAIERDASRNMTVSEYSRMLIKKL